MTKYADDQTAENARKLMEHDKRVVERSRVEYAQRSKGRPTPTQEELDMAAHGAHILEHDEDGSDPDPNNQAVQGKSMEAGPAPKHYQTKSGHASKSDT
jgi:hypothetical protein